MATRKCDWIAEVSRGPDWLFVRLKPGEPTQPGACQLADRISQLLTKHFLNRVVIELDQLPEVDESLLRELKSLSEWVSDRDGMLRVSGTPCRCRTDLASELRDRHLPHYANRRLAVTARELPRP